MPMSPPISACEELEGRPARHVMRFQAIAPNSAAMIIESPTPCSGATRLPMVSATFALRSCVVTTAPMRLRTAEKMTATRGRSARVPTVVAMAFAVSWKPLEKSKASATAMVRKRRSICSSGILDRNSLEYIRHVLAAVESVLEEGVQILQLNHLKGQMLTTKEFGNSTARRRVSDILKPVNFDNIFAALLARPKLADR